MTEKQKHKMPTRKIFDEAVNANYSALAIVCICERVLFDMHEKDAVIIGGNASKALETARDLMPVAINTLEVGQSAADEGSAAKGGAS